MHKVDVVRPHQLISTKDAEFEIPISAANFAATCSTYPVISPQTDVVTVNDTVKSLSFFQDDSELWTIAQDDAWSFGVFFDGQHPQFQKPFHVNVSGSLQGENLSGGADVPMSFIVGRLASGSPLITRNAEVNTLDRVCLLGFDAARVAGNVLTASIERSLLFGDPLNDDNNDNTQPYFFGVYFAAEGSGSRALQNFRGSLSVYKYTTLLQTYDPPR